MPRVRCTDCKGPLPEGRKGGVCDECKVFNRFIYELMLGAVDRSPEATAERARRANIYKGRFERGEPIFQEELINGGTEDNQNVQVAQSGRDEDWEAHSDTNTDETDED